MKAKAWEIRCTVCGKRDTRFPPDYCEACGAPQEVHLDYEGVDARSLFDGQIRDLWKYAPLYPVERPLQSLSLGEGGTPLIPASRAGQDLDTPDLWCKLDHLNPSGSFKDRCVVVGMAHALERGAEAVVCASSGNAAGSVATYAARAGVPAVILIPASTPAPKVAVAMAHGALVFRVEGDFSRSFQLARQLGHVKGWVNLTTTFVNAVAIEGNKSVAYELFEQLGGVPDWIVVPVSSGPLLFGVWKGFLELIRFGLADRMPRLVAAQPSGCAPIARSFDENRDDVTAWERVETVVSGLNDPLVGYEGDGELTLRAVRETNGVALAVPDSVIFEAGQVVAQREGLFVEPAAATSIAGVAELRRRGAITKGDKVVCLLTGHGLKQPWTGSRAEPPLVSGISDLLDSIGNLDLQTSL